MVVAEIAEALRPRVLAYLRQVDGFVGIGELREVLGHSGLEIKDEQAKEPWREDKGLMEFLKATCAAMMIGLSCAGRVSLP